MGWDFSTEPDFQKKLDWVEEFCREEIEPLDLVFPYAVRSKDPRNRGAREASARPSQGQGRILPPKSANETPSSSRGSMWVYWRSVNSGSRCPSCPATHRRLFQAARGREP